MSAGWKKRLTQVLLLLIAGVIVIPVSAYAVGMALVGVYEGNGGVAGYTASILAAAWRGDLAARLIVLSPLGLGLIWTVAVHFRRASAADPEPSTD